MWKSEDGGQTFQKVFTKDAPTGPPPEFRFTEAQITSELMQAGYRLTESHTFLPRQLFLVYHFD